MARERSFFFFFLLCSFVKMEYSLFARLAFPSKLGVDAPDSRC
jgi:hypothetical protein